MNDTISSLMQNADRQEYIALLNAELDVVKAELTALREKVGVCHWTQDDNWDMSDNWTADCGMEWCMTEGTPSENKMKFCPSCGKPLVEVPYVEPPVEDDQKEEGR